MLLLLNSFGFVPGQPLKPQMPIYATVIKDEERKRRKRDEESMITMILARIANDDND